MKILVTGGAGFIGSHVVDALLKQGHDVAVVDNLSRGKKEYVAPQARFYHGDILSTRLAHIFEIEQPEVVIHNAAHISVPRSIEDPVHDVHQNILGSLQVFEQARLRNVKKIIFASSGGAIYGQAEIYPTPEDYPARVPFSWCTAPYCIAKFTVESYLMYYQQIHQIPFVALRFANVYGPRQDSTGEGAVIPTLAKKMLHHERPTIYGNGTQTRDFVYVGDVVQAYLAAIDRANNKCFNVSTGTETSINTLYEKLASLLGVQEPPHYGTTRAGDVTNSVLDNTHIQKELGWAPQTSLDQGLQKTLRWLQWYHKRIP